MTPMYTPTDQQLKAIDRTFQYHPPFSPSQPERYEALRAKAKELATLMAQACPVSRELSLAHTHLQEAVMWANAAIAINEVAPSQQVTPAPVAADPASQGIKLAYPVYFSFDGKGFRITEVGARPEVWSPIEKAWFLAVHTFPTEQSAIGAEGVRPLGSERAAKDFHKQVDSPPTAV